MPEPRLPFPLPVPATLPLSRRAFTAGLGGAGLAVLAAPLLATPATANPAADHWRRRALDGYAALQRHLYPRTPACTTKAWTPSRGRTSTASSGRCARPRRPP
ncbi:hypothetical protein [Promicromonospora iranensis]|uniref:Uncharacterized protein n=1 Tax=Promicromonospora iranensis TaxID=1105144 RepID=A0ABU2CKB3_9MICO|nr:hypothetical protein [Promicromonospora iranensis]MDR7381759.1 hypothetical protein [Promicromonospora iranensis]